MPAGRVNKKFVLLLVSVLVILALVGGGPGVGIHETPRPDQPRPAGRRPHGQGRLRQRRAGMPTGRQPQTRRPDDIFSSSFPPKSRFPVDNAEGGPRHLLTGLRRGYMGVLQIELRQSAEASREVVRPLPVPSWRRRQRRRAWTRCSSKPRPLRRTSTCDSLVAKKYRGGIARINRDNEDHRLDARGSAACLGRPPHGRCLKTSTTRSPPRYLSVGDVLQRRLLDRPGRRSSQGHGTTRRGPQGH